MQRTGIVSLLMAGSGQSSREVPGGARHLGQITELAREQPDETAVVQDGASPLQEEDIRQEREKESRKTSPYPQSACEFHMK